MLVILLGHKENIEAVVDLVSAENAIRNENNRDSGEYWDRN